MLISGVKFEDPKHPMLLRKLEYREAKPSRSTSPLFSCFERLHLKRPQGPGKQRVWWQCRSPFGHSTCSGLTSTRCAEHYPFTASSSLRPAVSLSSGVILSNPQEQPSFVTVTAKVFPRAEALNSILSPGYHRQSRTALETRRFRASHST